MKVIIIFFIIVRLIECKENNFLSFLYNLFLVIMYICWKIKGRKREICNLINRLFERNLCSYIYSIDMLGIFVLVFNI